MSRTARFFDIIQILRETEKPVIAKELAERLEVNIRTVYRDIASLQASGIPIAGEAGVGYVMQSGFELPPLMFTQEELEAIGVGLSLLGRSGDTGLMKAASSVAAKIADVATDNGNRLSPFRVSTWHQIPQTTLSTQQIRQCIRNEVEVHITYEDLKGKTSKRNVKPVALFYYVDAILLVAWCTLRNDFRHFRLDHIKEWQTTGQSFAGEGTKLLEKWESSREK